MLLEIYKQDWKEEQIPVDWQTCLIVPIFKKGDSKDCNNYGRITLLGTFMKIYERILKSKLRKIIEPILDESQRGFESGRSTQDHIFTIKEIRNIKLSRNNDIFLAFIYMKKAFDRVPCNAI